jgi:3-hydroxyisobutyrate dehydrogenase-like beta-hydroxyacid dehydrogenase
MTLDTRLTGESRKMTDVTVIGTGVMGSALVHALTGSGAEVTVWNRTKKKAEALSGPKVRVVESIAGAIKSSPLSIIVVSDQELSQNLIKESGADLDGRAIASTAFVTPDQGHAFDTIVNGMGGKYLDLSIPAYPGEVRSGAGIFFLSGSHEAFEKHSHHFERIGRITTFVDETPSAAYISEMAVLLAYLPMSVGFLQGLRICEHHNISREWFRDTAFELYQYHIRSLLNRVTGESPDTKVEASVNTWGRSAAEYAGYLQEIGLDSGVYDALSRLFKAAAEAGDGETDWTCIARHSATH